jgi:very-short-patch-repair endonuclease
VLDGRLDLVRRKAEQWARELTDFGPGNTLLHFRDTRALTVDLTDGHPDELARLLAGRRTRLSALFPDPEALRLASGRMRTLRRRVVLVAEEQGVEIGRVARGLLTVPAPPGLRGATALRPLRAPMLLQAVRIEPRTATETDHTLELDQEVEVNPVLLVALRDHHGVDLDIDATTRRLVAAADEADGPDAQLDAVFGLMEPLLTAQGRTPGLERRTVVGTFVFDKLPMVQDLRSSTELLAAHDVIAAAAGVPEALASLRNTHVVHRVRDTDEVAPADEFLVLDADSSQQRAVHAVLGGQHVVIQGPPGTGKSQTIANLIAGAAAAGESVLFVAEKRAAIEAVTERLAAVDLAELVFDLHGRQRTKREVAAQVAASLERLGGALPPDVAEVQRGLAESRRELLRHAEELHRPREPWGPSAYEVQVALMGLPERSRTPLRLRRAALRHLDHATVGSLVDELAAYVRAGGPAVRRGDSAWSRAEVPDRDAAERTLVQLDTVTGRAWRSSQESLQALVARAGLRVPADLAGWRRVLQLLSDVARTVQLHGADVYGEQLDARCGAACTGADRTPHPTSEWWWRRYVRRREAWAQRRSERCARDQLAAELRAAVAERAVWQELATDARAIPSAVDLVGELETFSALRDDVAAVALTARLGEPDGVPVEQLTATLERLRAEERTLFKLPELTRIARRLEEHGLAEVLDEVARHDATPDEAQDLLWHVWYQSLLDLYRLDSPVLAMTGAAQLNAVGDRFRDLDAQHLRLNAARVRRRIAERLRDARDDHPEQNRTVLAEAKRKRGHMPVRALVAQAPDVLLAARPCWAMSPIVVSRLLPAQRLFDLVVFDEASQVEPVDAMTSIMRGERLVVAGDDKQLPPSMYFRTLAVGGVPDDELDDDAAPPPARIGDYESVLTCLAALLPQTVRLCWHYRSEDERLIAFSNEEFYDGDLVTFPGRAIETPLRLHVVEGSAAPGSGGLVDAEIRRVIDLVVEHAQEHPDDSLGVITANVDHRDRIEGVLQQAAAAHPAVEAFRARMDGPRRRLFVKSLEMVQGDERDVVILSLGRSKGADGRLRMHFGPITHDGGERRLNVAVTRARRRLHVVSAFTHEDMPAAWPKAGPAALRRFLEVAATGARPAAIGRAVDVSLNPFERDVLDALVKRGIPTVPQWGVSGYRIDFALGDPEREGRMVLAVEADGDRYHRLPSVRDRDRLRQGHLERMGWEFHRVWASAWFADPDGEADRIEEHWRRTLARPAQPAARRAAEPAAPPPSAGRRRPRPSVPPGQRIDQYTDADLDRMACWVLSDGLALDRDTRCEQLRSALGFTRAGSRIVARCYAALDRCRDTQEAG